MAKRRRLDHELVRRELAPDHDQAAKAIAANKVRVNGAIVDKPSRQVLPGDAVVVVEPERFVGRGAQKLLAALDAFSIAAKGLRCLDVGASTGGFTDVLLQRDAAHVVALDVGRAQIHERIAADERVKVLESTNFRHVSTGDLGKPFDLVVVDVSFISLRTLMPQLAEQTKPGGKLVSLIKPQFEVSRGDAARGNGVVTDPSLWQKSILSVTTEAQIHAFGFVGLIPSPITGGEGNVEFLAHFNRATSGQLDSPPTPDIAATVAKVRTVTPHDLP